MTRQEQKELKKQKEIDFINQYKNKNINQDIKKKFRLTSVWKDFRKQLYIKEVKTLKNGKEKIICNVDELTLRPLKKEYQLHHCDLNSKHYFNLDKNNFALLNSASHDIVHTIYSEVCKDKQYLDRLINLINKMGELNDWKDIKDFD